MTLKLLGKKKGMAKRFDEAGNLVVCTVIHVEPNVVTQIKRPDVDGYSAIQLGFDKVVVKDQRTLSKRLNKQQLGHFKKANVEPRRHLCECRLDAVEEYKLGQELDLSLFQDVEYIDVIGTSKGKGFQGVMKRHNFAGGPAAHGSGFHRHAGSTGMRSTPGRGLPGGKKAGRMGAERVTIQNIQVVAVDAEKNILLVKGSIPGPKGGVVSLTPAMKKKK